MRVPHPLTSIGAHVYIVTDGYAHTVINKETKVYGEIVKAHLPGLFFIVAIAIIVD